MLASKLLASSALALTFWSAAAAADETAKPTAPAAKGNVVTIEIVKIKGRRQLPNVSVDVAVIAPRLPLPELQKPPVDRIGKAVEAEPF